MFLTNTCCWNDYPTEAVEALNTLKPADITVVKSMKNPPHAIKLVMAAVCVMLEIKPEKLKNTSVKAVMCFSPYISLIQYAYVRWMTVVPGGEGSGYC